MRDDAEESYTYHDRIFANELNHLVHTSNTNYEQMLFREAVKTGFYDLQAARDRYRDLTAAGGGMNWGLVLRFIEARHAIME